MCVCVCAFGGGKLSFSTDLGNIMYSGFYLLFQRLIHSFNRYLFMELFLCAQHCVNAGNIVVCWPG